MAFPTYQSNTDTDFATSVTSMAVNLPATVNAGDLLIAICSVRNAGTWTTVPTDWNNIKEQLGGASVGELSVFYKIADGSEDGGTATWITGTGTSAAWTVLRITDWHGTQAPEITSTSGDASNANPPTITASWGSDDNLFVAVASNSATGETTGFTAAPTNYINLHSNGASSGGATCNVASSTRQLAADSDDPGTFTPNSNRFWAAATIVIRPAAGGGTEETAPDPVGLTLTATSTTASFSEVDSTAASPVSLTLSVVQPTVTYIQVESVAPDPSAVSISVVVPTVTYVQIESASVSPEVLNLTVVTPTSSYLEIDSTSVSPANLLLSVVQPVSTYIQVETTTPDPLNAVLSSITPIVVFADEDAPAPLVLQITPITPSTSYIQVESVSASPVSLLLSVPLATESYAAVYETAPDPVGLDVIIPNVAASSILTFNANVSPLQLILSINSLTPTALIGPYYSFTNVIFYEIAGVTMFERTSGDWYEPDPIFFSSPNEVNWNDK